MRIDDGNCAKASSPLTELLALLVEVLEKVEVLLVLVAKSLLFVITRPSLVSLLLLTLPLARRWVMFIGSKQQMVGTLEAVSAASVPSAVSRLRTDMVSTISSLVFYVSII